MTLYRETPCPDCGRLTGITNGDGQNRDGSFYHHKGPNPCPGPGGSRTEVVIDYEAAISAYHGTGVPHDPHKDVPKAVDAALGISDG